MKIGFIGAGKVGISLALFLKSCGETVTGFFTRSDISKERAKEYLNVTIYKSKEALIQDCDCIFIATPDDSIASVAREIADYSLSFKGKTVCHMSGALSSSVLSPLLKKGAAVFSVHPPYSFADVVTDTAVLDALTFTAEGEGDNAVIDRLFPHIRYIKPAQKPLYHAAMCMISNYFVTLMENTSQILAPLQLNPDDFFPLLMGTIQNIKEKGTQDALTGPIVRGDIGTVRLHLDHLPDSAVKDFYKQMGIHTANLAYAAHKIDKNTHIKLQEVLNDE